MAILEKTNRSKVTDCNATNLTQIQQLDFMLCKRQEILVLKESSKIKLSIAFGYLEQEHNLGYNTARIDKVKG